jgi:hypothetical protein
MSMKVGDYVEVHGKVVALNGDHVTLDYDIFYITNDPKDEAPQIPGLKPELNTSVADDSVGSDNAPAD